jgi:hypothetical protein
VTVYFFKLVWLIYLTKVDGKLYFLGRDPNYSYFTGNEINWKPFELKQFENVYIKKIDYFYRNILILTGNIYALMKMMEGYLHMGIFPEVTFKTKKNSFKLTFKIKKFQMLNWDRTQF